MKRFVLVLLILALIPTLTYAGWWRTYGGEGNDFGYCVQQTNDSGFVITGSKNDDLWLVKTETNGDTLWTRTYGGNYTDIGYCVRQTKDVGYIVAGETFIEGEGSRMWLLKIDSLGNTMWNKEYDLHGYGSGGRWVEQTSDEGYIVTGYTVEYLDKSDLWLLKTDSLGDTCWSTLFIECNYGCGLCVQKTSDYGYIVSGYSQVYHYDGWWTYDEMIKTDSSGKVEWGKAPHGTHWGYMPGNGPEGRCVCEAYGSGYIMVGDFGIMKVNSMGDSLWYKGYGGEAYCISQTNDGNYIVSGKVRLRLNAEYAFLLKINDDGDSLWMRTFGEKDQNCRWVGYSVQQTLDGGFILAGAKDGDLYLLKTDSLGNLAIEESPTPATQPNWQVISSIGRTITLRAPEGTGPIYLAVFDASGRQVDEIRLSSENLIWGQGQPTGVYFIREMSKNTIIHKVVLVR